MARGAGYNTTVNNFTLAQTVGRVIQVVLSIVGLLFFVLVFYAGYLWFMARGDEGEVEKAQSIIKMAVIGLLITFSAFTISFYIVRMVGGVAGGNNRVGASNMNQPLPQQGGAVPGSDCKNNKKDNFETDVDCGGGSPSCDKCAEGKGCISNSDCVSNVCTSNKCQASTGGADTCENGNKDGDESDIDCGGLTCERRCASGGACFTDSDCSTNKCAGHKCVTL